MSPIYRIKSYYSESSVVITIEPRNQAGLMNSTSQTWLLLSRIRLMICASLLIHVILRANHV